MSWFGMNILSSAVIQNTNSKISELITVKKTLKKKHTKQINTWSYLKIWKCAVNQLSQQLAKISAFQAQTACLTGLPTTLEHQLKPHQNCSVLIYLTQSFLKRPKDAGQTLVSDAPFSSCQLLIKRCWVGRQEAEQVVKLAEVRARPLQPELQRVMAEVPECWHHLPRCMLVVQEGDEDQASWVHLLAVLLVQLSKPERIMEE